MKITARTGIWILAILLAGLVLATVSLGALVRSERFKEWLVAEISQRSGLSVRAQSIRFVLPFALLAENVAVSEPGQFHIDALRLRATVAPWSRSIERLIIEQPRLYLDLDELKLGATQDSTEIALRDLIVQNGSVLIKSGGQTVFELENINLRAQDLNLAARAGLTLVAAVPQLNGIAELHVSGPPRAMDARLILRQKAAASSGRSQPADELIRTDLEFRARNGESIGAVIKSKFHGLEYAGNQFTGSLSLKGEIAADLTSVTFTATGVLADFPNSFRAVPIKLPNGAINASLAGQFSSASKMLTLSSIQLSAPFGHALGEAQVNLGDGETISAAKLVFRDLPVELLGANLPAPLNSWSYKGLSRLSLEAHGPWSALVLKGLLESDSVRLNGESVTAATLALSAPFEWSGALLRLREVKVTVDRVMYQPKGRWQGGAEKLRLVSSLSHRAGEPTKIEGNIELSGAKFNSPSNTELGENLSIKGPFQFTTDPAKQTTSLIGKFMIEAGEVLWGKFFGDLTTQRPILEIDADYLGNQDRLNCRRCDFHLSTVGEIASVGLLERVSAAPALRLRVTSKDFSPEGFFGFFIRETFKRQYPVLEKLALAGRMAFDLQVEGQLDTLGAAGLLTWTGGAVRPKSTVPNDWRIGSVALNLPLQVYLGTDNRAATGPPVRAGRLVMDDIRFAGQTLAPMAIALSLTQNTLRVNRPISIEAFGGAIVIQNLSWPDLIHDPKRLSFSAEVKRLKLDDLTQALDWPRLIGTLSGSIPEVQATEQLLRTRGEIQAELFGGKIAVNKLEVGDPFSSLASIKFDARAENLHMEQMTQAFSFGRISGILEGTLENLVLINGQAAEFRAEFHSVDRGGEQRISVEALDKITVLSSGEDAGALYGGLARLFDSFRYSKLGFRATLKNDRLTLAGIESRAGQEMLVVGSLLPPTVNVVSHTQNIAFSELMRRLERVNKTGQPNVQ
jgi:hypothetical protein